jgi:uncharacterized membrane protein YjjP (DUF1212 family)
MATVAKVAFSVGMVLAVVGIVILGACGIIVKPWYGDWIAFPITFLGFCIVMIVGVCVLIHAVFKY